MAELFKNAFNREFIDSLSYEVLKVFPDFDKISFTEQVFDSEWENKELKQRMRHISIVLNQHLTNDFGTNADVILKVIQQLQEKGTKTGGIAHIFFPDFIELYGIDHYEIAIPALEQITQLISCEFAVRPFIIKYQDKMMEQMMKWSYHKNEWVRRLSTEGCRPRLPWAIAIPAFKKNPAPVIPILENLKNDESESVRKSVANNLNDISKDNPQTAIRIAKEWKGKTKETDRVVKHGCRTLLKQGNPEVMELFGFKSIDEIKISDFKIHTPKVKIGSHLEFSFKLINTSNSAAKIRLEYGLYYQKANGTLSKKVYSISEKQYAENSTTEIVRKQSFKVITTRKLHKGLHQLSLIINGNELEKYDFLLNNNN